jgi:hypothetical protein
MYIDGEILDSQKKGAIVRISKKSTHSQPSDFRSLTLLNAELKLLSRILANRLKRRLPEIMHPKQFCGTSDNNIHGALAAIRETIAHSEHTNAPACIFSLDFQNAFDNIAHTYLFEILKAYGFSDTFRHRLTCLYMNATTLVHINGHLSSPIQIQSSKRQGCRLAWLSFLSA